MSIDRYVPAFPAEKSAIGRESGSVKRIPGEIGIWVFIYGDLVVFALLFGLFAIYRRRQPEVFHSSQHAMIQVLGLTNTIVLLVSSLFVVLGMRALKSRDRSAARSFTIALVCGAAFVGIKAIEWTAKLSDGHTMYSDDYFQLYYVLTGVHLVHVAVGMVVLMYLIRTARLTVVGPDRMASAESGACFWHMVDLLWVVIFPLCYLLV
ncbi:cytochrome c oxidase subunit 3 family protein [Tsukamurella sputi]|nr:cytochrome c oxidase subunit 3 family protein [Tsukamurella sputi]